MWERDESVLRRRRRVFATTSCGDGGEPVLRAPGISAANQLVILLLVQNDRRRLCVAVDNLVGSSATHDLITLSIRNLAAFALPWLEPQEGQHR